MTDLLARSTTKTVPSSSPPPHAGETRCVDRHNAEGASRGPPLHGSFGRYAKILKRDLGDYRIVQDTRFSIGDPEADPTVGGRADAPRTHVYLTPDGDDDFARDALDVAEQTCFIHALCRTELRPKVKVLPWSRES